MTYGSFAPRDDGQPFPEPTQIKHDFVAIANSGLNTVRTYDRPPSELLELAEECGLRVLVGLSFADWRMETGSGRAAGARVLAEGRRAVDAVMEQCAGNDVVLGVAVGNELPSDLVRLHGIRSVEQTYSALVAAVHDADPEMLATYVSFPTTEFLHVDGMDFVAFNVFLEDPDALRRYLRHLQVVAGERPLVVTELGLAAEVHGPCEQAASLRRQLSLVDETGCAGATIFAWTDEWAVAGVAVDGWGFGITDAERKPKPAFDVVSSWAAAEVDEQRDHWPRVSVIVCAYNEQATIEECLASLELCTYPDLEVIVCDDGSSDRTLEIARRFPFRILELPHGGLSNARNAGLRASTGTIVAYLDADAACHPEWPFHLALSMEDEGVVATGGPNLPVRESGLTERAVALAPGGPVEVLAADDRAEHVPGCNMAFARSSLDEIGGFDPRYTAAGDDVDVCWKLLERGDEIAFAPAAQVRHHRRGTVRAYLRQQRGYGRAERLLAVAHPQRFNRLGQARWGGVIYGGAAILPRLFRPVVYHGYSGSAAFQPVVHRRAQAANMWSAAFLPAALPLAVAGLVVGIVWPWALAVTALSVLTVLAYGVAVAAAVRPERGEPEPVRLRFLVATLHVLQPFARTWGRLRGPTGAQPGSAARRRHPSWVGDRFTWLGQLEDDLRARRCSVHVAEPSDAWDVVVFVGPLVAARVTTAMAWSWEPRAAVQYRPRFLLLLTAALIIAAAAFVSPWVLAFVVPLAALGAAELVVLRRRLEAALHHTTEPARV